MACGVAEYVAVFGLVLLHEFGHVLACRSVGGRAERILLWPLGGLAFVNPPQRPGPYLWVTAAGPLVNLVLAPLLIWSYYAIAPTAEPPLADFVQFLWALVWFNMVILILNLIPVFPLDGGRILQSLLWFLIGRSRALAVSAGIGLFAAAALFVFTLLSKLWWFALVAAFLLLGSFVGLKTALILLRIDRLPRRVDLFCPRCHASPPVGECWRCDACRNTIDLFDQGVCPGCGILFAYAMCTECGEPSPMVEWCRAEVILEAGTTVLTDPPTTDAAATPWFTSDQPPGENTSAGSS
jgi:Zn-dependent protease